MKNHKKTEISIDKKIDEIINSIQKLIAIQLYMGGSKQTEISENLGIALGTVNKLVKGVKSPKLNHEK
jgi:hypothetical protein